jgi:hypothetical protein
MKTKNYIQFRVFFEDGVAPEFVDEVADNLQDIIIDFIGEEGLPHFNQDVTFEKIVEVEMKK